MVVIDLHSHDKVTRDDIHWLSDSLRNKCKKKQNVIALISGSYNLCSSATQVIAMQKHLIGDAVAFVVQSRCMNINDLYYAQFSYLKGKNVAYFNDMNVAYDWVKQNSVQAEEMHDF